MIRFNVPPFTGKEMDYIRQAVENQKICGDGEFTRKCSEWIEERTGTRKCLLTTSCTHATELAALCGLGSRLTTVLSDGMAHLGPDEADAIAICGMGGELIARILEANLPAAKNARCITMQPMRGIEELRQFLRKNEFRIIDERLVLDAGRIYQIIGAKSGDPSPLPGWFPQDEYSIGPMLFEKRDPLLIPLLESYRDGHLRRLEKARRKGVTPKALTEIIGRMNGYINIAQEMHKNEAE